jgi:undecaprenyl-diphosphatase
METNTSGVKAPMLGRRGVVAILAVGAVLWTAAVFLWWQAGFDKWLLIGLNGLRTNRLVVGVAQAATHLGMAAIVLVYLLYLLLAFRCEKLRVAYPAFLLVFLMFALGAIGGDGLKGVFSRPRPFVEYSGEINALSKAASPSFPSGHAAKSVALALPFLLLVAANDRWHKGVKALLAILALGVCCSRVVLGAHYVSDVLAGAGLALMFFPLGTLLNRKLLGQMSAERLRRAPRIWAVILLGLMIYLAVQ